MPKTYIFFVISLFFTFTITAFSDDNGKNIGSYIKLEELKIDDISKNGKTIEVYKTDIFSKSEFKFFEALNQYKNGELKVSRIHFDNFIEHLEYLHPETDTPDSILLSEFWNTASKDPGFESDLTVFELYDLLYSENSVFETDSDRVTQLIQENEKTDQGAVEVKQNNKEYLYAKEKAEKLLEQLGLSDVSEDFMQLVYSAYLEYLYDKVNVQEIYLRMKKFEDFILESLDREKVDRLFLYVPAIMSSYYNNSRNGGVWHLDNIKEYRTIRDDVGASTAIVIEKIKNKLKTSKKYETISRIITDRSYLFDENSNSNILNEEFADFIALTIVLKFPYDHDIKVFAERPEKLDEYRKNYLEYKKNPNSYIKKSKPTPTRKSSKYYVLYYKVNKGDSLSEIAELYKCGVDEIKKWNPRDTKGGNIYPGAKLYIRAYNLKKYKARSGDTLIGIAAKHRMSYTEFKKINKLRSDKIYRGNYYYVYR